MVSLLELILTSSFERGECLSDKLGSDREVREGGNNRPGSGSPSGGGGLESLTYLYAF